MSHKHNAGSKCPVCGKRCTIFAVLKDGRLVGTCGDAFTVARWNECETCGAPDVRRLEEQRR